MHVKFATYDIIGVVSVDHCGFQLSESKITRMHSSRMSAC